MRYAIAATILSAAMGLAPAAQADRLLYRVGPTNQVQTQNQNQTAQILGGLAALGALGLVIKGLNDDDDDDRRRIRDRRDHPDYRQYRQYRDRDDRGGRRLRHANVLPGDCLRVVDNRRGPDRVFGARCLARSGVELRQLPRSCRTDVLAGGRYRAAYAAPCLRHQGWRVARHR